MKSSNGSRQARHRKSLGQRGEDAAAHYLSARLGWTVIARNWRCQEGELDIVAYDGRQHVVCEVKTRAGIALGTPFEAITTDKAARLRRLAGRWAAQHGVPGHQVRIDVLGLVAERDGSFELDHVREVC